jgi:ribosomal protein S18 acetylase RimI-like enzyme
MEQTSQIVVRRAAADQLEALAALAEPLQQRSDRHITYLSSEAAAIAVELPSEDEDWTAVSAVAERDGETVGWLMGSVDYEMGRVWWYGPFVADRAGPWAPAAAALYDHAVGLLPADVTEQEMAIDPAFEEMERFAVERGFVVDPGSVILTRSLADGGEHDRAGSSIRVRPAVEADLDIIAPLHDDLFAGSHLVGRKLLDDPDGLHRRMVATIDDAAFGGRPVGYVAMERTADGEAYIDYIGVDPAARRRGVARAMIVAALAEGIEMGCHRAALTVREASDGARALYRSTGFVEERIIRPMRIGFRLL